MNAQSEIQPVHELGPRATILVPALVSCIFAVIVVVSSQTIPFSHVVGLLLVTVDLGLILNLGLCLFSDHRINGQKEFLDKIGQEILVIMMKNEGIGKSKIKESLSKSHRPYFYYAWKLLRKRGDVLER